jgi:hypothetical protein
MILKRIVKSLAPSIRADSERLSGIADMAVRQMMQLKTLMAVGSTSAQKEL